MKKNRYVAIMAGGIGSRFWPKSRIAHPKQFLDILGTGKTLIQETFTRFSKLVPVQNIFVVTAVEYVDTVKQQLDQLPPENILAEPSRKNTAPCIAYIAYKLSQRDPDALLIASPADNHINDTAAFLQTAEDAFNFIEVNDALVTIGIKPTSPKTGYGYIQHGDEVAAGIHKVKTFTEKPSLELAKTFIESGDFWWNAGIFSWQVKSILTAIGKYLPGIHKAFESGKDKLNTLAEAGVVEDIYRECPNISIDFGVMEKAANVYVIPAYFPWSDLGTWNSAWENTDKDYFQNAVSGKNVTVVDTQKCIVHAPDNKLVLLQGIDDYIVVDTKDVLMICKREKEQEIKEYVAELKRIKGETFL
jgi:mannose-1-phosphate guanylyltransferase